MYDYYSNLTALCERRANGRVTHHLSDDGGPEGGEVLGRHAQDEDTEAEEDLHHQAGDLGQTQTLCQPLCKWNTTHTHTRQQSAHQRSDMSPPNN